VKIKKDDTVLVTKGKYRGKTGKILRAIPKENRVVVEGVNIVKKHTRPRKTGEKGKILEISAPIQVSSVKLICPKCKKPTKIQYKIVKSKVKSPASAKASAGKQKLKIKKIRMCKKCGKEI
jgi:large subunit ribosomal protein L24